MQYLDAEVVDAAHNRADRLAAKADQALGDVEGPYAAPSLVAFAKVGAYALASISKRLEAHHLERLIERL
jgi:hypothetical protein